MATLNECILLKESGRLSSESPKIYALVSHSSANFQPILDCLIPNFELKYEDSGNIKADLLTTVVFNLHKFVVFFKPVHHWLKSWFKFHVHFKH